jgi:two-component system CitB family sensor kinase
MLTRVRRQPRSWSLARQLVVLQLCVVVTAVAIEATVAVIHVPHRIADVEQLKLLGLVTLTAVALLVGIAGSLFVADRVSQQTFDMEPAQIARLYQQRSAMLHAVREGLIITDVNGDIVLANDEARRLLGLAGDCELKSLRDQVPDAEWAATETPVTDQLYYTAERFLMVSRSEAEVDGVPAGLVTTLRDRTELEQALHERKAAQVVADELSQQAHEHANHVQTIIGLIFTGQYHEAVKVGLKHGKMPKAPSGQLLDQVTDPVLATRLQMSHTLAEEHGVEFRLDCSPGTGWRDISADLADIVGNLVDNAIDAVSGLPGGWVQLTIAGTAEDGLHICVRDNGLGLPPDDVFERGWTTKGYGHGFGLALVRDLATGLHGQITHRNDCGAVFDVRIPPAGTTGEQE